MDDNPYQSPTAPLESPESIPDVPQVNAPVVARYLWTADEFMLAYDAHQQHKCRRGFRVALILLCGVLTGLVWLALGTSPLFFIGLGCAVGLYLTLFNRSLLRWRIRRQFAKRPDSEAETEWHFTPDSVLVATPSSRSERSWNHFSQMVDSPNGVLLYLNHKMFHWIPHHAFASDVDYTRFLQLAESQIAHCRRIK